MVHDLARSGPALPLGSSFTSPAYTMPMMLYEMESVTMAGSRVLAQVAVPARPFQRRVFIGPLLLGGGLAPAPPPDPQAETAVTSAPAATTARNGLRNRVAIT